jgi:hypothetical protein
MDAGASVSGRLKHDQFLGHDQTIDFGFDFAEDEQSYDLLFQNNGIGDGNPKFAFVLGRWALIRLRHFSGLRRFFLTQAPD